VEPGDLPVAFRHGQDRDGGLVVDTRAENESGDNAACKKQANDQKGPKIHLLFVFSVLFLVSN
jgi:hypothetical protein